MLHPLDRKLAEIASAQHGIFTIADARDAGLSEKQIERRTHQLWIPIHAGVYRMLGSVVSWRGDLYAACRAASAPVAVSRNAAAALYDLPGGKEIVEIECRRWNRTQRPGLIVHESSRFDDQDIVEIDGIPVVTAERLILEMAGVKPFPDYIERLIQAARRKRLITYDSTLQTFNRLARRGLRGVRPTRIALDRWNPRSQPTESDMETLLIQVLRDHGLPEPVTQFVVRDDGGNFVARTDAALPGWHIIVDYQSKQEHLDEFQSLRDDRRRNAILGAGYYPVAARYEDLRAGGEVLAAQIRRIARRQAS